MDKTEKWVGICFMLILFGMGLMAWKAQDMRQNCRIETVSYTHLTLPTNREV